MSNRQFRMLTRAGHLVESCAVFLYFYSPLGNDPTFEFIVKFIFLPALVISGTLLWQQARILKTFRRYSAQAARACRFV
jgi:hypothetical protein